jgi:hypothetical protein
MTALVSRFRTIAAFSIAIAAAASASVSRAQLVVSEVLANPLSSNDAAWEWIEVKNTGATPVNLNGYIAGKFGENPNTFADISDTKASNTIIPAGGVGVLYSGAGTNYNDSLFRQAWGLSPSVPLVAVSGWPSLANSNAGQFGFWSSADDYNLDLNAISHQIDKYDHASFYLNYGNPGFPLATNRASSDPGRESMVWNGAGDYHDGSTGNWTLSASGANGAVTSMPVSGALDVGNPGIVPAGAKPAGVFFTEIMYNPASDEPQWEWAEVFNNSGSTIDFGATNGVLDDDDGSVLGAANIKSGAIPNNSAAILFNNGGSASTALTLQQFKDAWDPGGALGLNIIPVNSTSSTQFELNQTGDKIGLWLSQTDYTSEANTGPGRTMDNAAASVSFDDDTASEPNTSGTWPTSDGFGSIYRTNYNDQSVGDNWALSTLGDVIGSYGAIQQVHPGGDIGSPGSFAPGGDADFNNDTVVDGADFLIWQRNLGSGTDNLTGDANGDGMVNNADLQVWQGQFGSTVSATAATATVPEPATALLTLLGLAAFAARRR